MHSTSPSLLERGAGWADAAAWLDVRSAGRDADKSNSLRESLGK
jgi:hypothetical protein